MLAGCPEGGVVLDPFSGAATTGIVAVQHGRRYIGIELNPVYVELASRRFEETIKTGASLNHALFHNLSSEAKVLAGQAESSGPVGDR
jgi:DNA modification methylase